jgi:hypothetical protein
MKKFFHLKNISNKIFIYTKKNKFNNKFQIFFSKNRYKKKKKFFKFYLYFLKGIFFS